MLSISGKSGKAETLAADAAAAAEYQDGENTKEKDDYYTKEEGFSHWGGNKELMERLGINPDSEPDIDTRIALMMGIDPSTGEQIVQCRARRKMGWDLTFSAPKSVSVVWGATENSDLKKAIQEAHNKAVEKALEEVQELTYRGMGSNGYGYKSKVDIVYSSHQHGTSRELDPQLHTHNFIYNIGSNEDGKLGRVQVEKVYDNKLYLGAAYRAELASQLRELGFEIEEDGSSFKLSDVSDDLCKRFSTRRNQIIEACIERGAFDGKTKADITLANRKKKIEGVNADALRPEWKAVARELGFKDFDFGDPLESKEYSRKAFLERLTIGESTFTEMDIKRELAVYAQHCGKGIDFIKAEYADVMSSDDLVLLRTAEPDAKPKVDAIYSTREMIQLERNMIDTAQKMRRSDGPATEFKTHLNAFQEKMGFELSGEQVNAIHEMCRGGQLSMIRGVAGAGKTTAAAVAFDAWRSEGRHVVGLAIAAKASRGLNKASHEQSTIARFLLEVESGRRKLTSKDVLLVDEAGMVGSRTTKMLLDRVDAAGAKIVLIGDEKQVQAIEAGGSFSALQRYAARDYAQIKEIRRQKDAAEGHLDAVYHFEAGRVEEGIKQLEDLGCVEIHDEPESAATAAAEAYFEMRKESNEKQVIVTAANHADVNAINEKIREELGLKGEGVTVKTEFGAAEFAMGDRIIFRQNRQGSNKKGKGGQPAKKDEVLTNGDLGTIERVEGTPERPIFMVRRDIDDALVKVDPAEYGHFKHGYAMTVHASQGVTVERAVGVANANSSLASREILYVQASRHELDFKLIGYADIDPEKVEEGLSEKGIKEPSEADFKAEERAQIRGRIVERYERSSAKNTTLDFTLKPDDYANAATTKVESETRDIKAAKHKGAEL